MQVRLSQQPPARHRPPRQEAEAQRLRLRPPRDQGEGGHRPVRQHRPPRRGGVPGHDPHRRQGPPPAGRRPPHRRAQRQDLRQVRGAPRARRHGRGADGRRRRRPPDRPRAQRRRLRGPRRGDEGQDFRRRRPGEAGGREARAEGDALLLGRQEERLPVQQRQAEVAGRRAGVGEAVSQRPHLRRAGRGQQVRHGGRQRGRARGRQGDPPRRARPAQEGGGQEEDRPHPPARPVQHLLEGVLTASAAADPACANGRNCKFRRRRSLRRSNRLWRRAEAFQPSCIQKCWRR